MSLNSSSKFRKKYQYQKVSRSRKLIWFDTFRRCIKTPAIIAWTISGFFLSTYYLEINEEAPFQNVPSFQRKILIIIYQFLRGGRTKPNASLTIYVFQMATMTIGPAGGIMSSAFEMLILDHNGAGRIYVTWSNHYFINQNRLFNDLERPLINRFRNAER